MNASPKDFGAEVGKRIIGKIKVIDEVEHGEQTGID